MKSRVVTKEILEKALNRKSAAGSTEKVVYSSKGPGGEPDKWWLVMEDRKDIWQIRETADADKRKKSLIFSYPTLAKRQPTTTELHLLPALLENYDVYLWEGKDTNLATATPITSTTQFWQSCGQSLSASEAEVKEAFDIQGKSQDDYIVLDATNYLQSLERLQNDFQPYDAHIAEKAQRYIYTSDGESVEVGGFQLDAPKLTTIPNTVNIGPNVLDLTNPIFKLEDALNTVDVNLVKEIIINAGDFDLIDLDSYPNLEKVCITANTSEQPNGTRKTDAYVEQINHFISTVNNKLNHHIVIEFKNFHSSTPEDPDKTIHLASTPKQKKVILNGIHNLGMVFFNNAAQTDDVEEIEITNTKITKWISLSCLKNLRRITLWNNFFYSNLPLSMDNMHLVEEINAPYVPLEPNADCSFLKLKKLSTSLESFETLYDEFDLPLLAEVRLGSNSKSVSLNKLTFAKKLTLERCNNSEFNLTDFDQLEELSLEGCSIGRFEGACPTLKRLSLDHTRNIKVLDLSRYPNLEELTIDSLYDLISLNLTNCTKLKKISIHSCQNLYHVECPNLPNLENFSFIGCPNLPNLEIISFDGNPHIGKMDISSAKQLKELTSDLGVGLVCSPLDLVLLDSTPNFPQGEIKAHTLQMHDGTVLDSDSEIIKNAEIIHIRDTNIASEQKFETNAKKIYLDNTPAFFDFKVCKNLTDLALFVTDFPLDNGQLNLPKNARSIMIMSPSSAPESLHISDFEMLEDLLLHGKKTLNQLSFKNCSKLKCLTLHCKALKDLDVSMLNNLEELYIDSAYPLKNLDLSKLIKLKRLIIIGCPRLKNLTLPPNLDYLKLVNDEDDAKLKSIDLSKCRSLIKLDITSPGCQLNNISTCELLEDIKLSANNSDYDLRSLKHLKKALLSSNKIQSIDCSGLNDLTQFQASSNKLENINIKHTHLRYFEVKAPPEMVLSGLTPENTPYHFYLDKSARQNHRFQKRERESAYYQFDAEEQTRRYSSNQSEHNIDSSLSTLSPDELLNLINRNTENLKSSVSCFSNRIDPLQKMDAGTGEQAIREAIPDIKVQVVSQYKSNRDYYRWEIFNQVRWQNGYPVLVSEPSVNCLEKNQVWPTFLDSELEELQERILNSPDQALGLMSGNLIPGQRYALTTEFPQTEFNIKIFCKDAAGNPVDATLIWDPDHRQHYIKVLRQVSALPIEIMYLATQAPNYDHKLSADKLKTHPSEELLPAEMLLVLNEIIENDAQLKDIFTHSTLDERLKALLNFFEHDVEQGDLSKQCDDPLEILKLILSERKGVCRHKAEAFTYLARYMGFEVNRVGSETHAFCEIRTSDNWYRIDLGGGVEWDNTKENVRESKLQAKSKKLRQTQVETELPIADFTPTVSQQSFFTPKIDPAVQMYMEAFNQVANESKLTKIAKLFSETYLFPPLLKLELNQDPHLVNATLFQQFKDSSFKDKDYIFINSAHEFAYYLSPPSLNKDGERKKIDGPLVDVIEKGGVIVVNWANFSPTEIATYKSILDTKPTLLGRTISPNTLVIGLQKNDSASCASFNSRCQPFTIDKSINLELPLYNPRAENIEPITINLFKLISWRKHLLGDIEFKGNEIILKPGPLKEAIDAGRPLIIENPPVRDKDFDLLMHRLLVEKRIFYNGVHVPIQDGFTIKTTVTKNDNTLHNVRVTSQTDSNDKREHIFIGLHNIHECIKHLRIKESLAEDVKGYLDTFNIDTQVFYVTQNIPEADWQYLLHQIKTDKHLSQKQFEFKLAPKVSIHNVASNNNTVELSENPPLYMCDDPDLIALILQDQLIADKKPLIIDISLNTTFSDLLAKIERKPHPEQPGKVSFEYTKSKLLKKLQKGRTIILNGPMSPTLYQQLLPIMTDPAHLQLNGKVKTIPGKLLSVQPSSQKSQYTEYMTGEFNLDLFLSLFPASEHSNIHKIIQFFKFAELLPHRGAGRPNKPQLTLQATIEMCKRLNSKRLHPNNPVKGLFHYDYPKDSEDYAYLNVMAKYMFADNVDTQSRYHKLHSLMKKYQINDASRMAPHVWHLLNCFNPTEIKQILGDNIEHILLTNRNYPELTPIVSDYLWKAIKPYLILAPEPADKKLHVDKRDEQFEILLKDPETSLIIFKGEAGSGKTYASEKLKQRKDVNYYEGNENGILEWLKNPGDQLTILALDEANMAKPGTWDFLKGLFRDVRNKKEVYYLGEKYTLTKNHKVVATGNPESYAERHHHDILQRYGETLYFKRPDDEYIKKDILNNILLPLKLNTEENFDAILASFNLIYDLNSNYYYSNRDIINVAERFISLYKQFQNQPSMEILYYACLSEFSGTLTKPSDRKQFERDLAQIFNLQPPQIEAIKAHFTEQLLPQENGHHLIELTQTCAVPKEGSYILESMQQALLTRDRLSSDHIEYHKRGFLIEGEPGLGKSTLIEALLEKNGFSKDSQDPKKKYYLISAGNESEVYTILEQAHKDGSIVILDEINLDKNAEERINVLLDKPAQDGREFMIFSSQNSSSSDGRAGTSPALRNRLHVVHMPPFSYKSLVDISHYWKVPDPEKFVEAYRACHKTNENINMRTFYNLTQQFGQRATLHKSLTTTS